MENRTFVAVKSLPETIKDALRSVGFAKADVAVVASQSVTLASSYGQGFRAYAVGLDIVTGTKRTIYGSWGGANPFERSIPDAQPTLDIPVNGAVITGQEGGGRPVSATIHVAPGTVAPWLNPPSDVTDRDRSILAIFGGIKPGYRAEYLGRANVTDAEVDSLVSRGFLSRNKAGATAITTAGKNARGNARAY